MELTVNIPTGSRPDRDTYFINMVRLVASRGTCARRKVGCVLVNEQGHVLATGYNGVCHGEPHCIDTPCAGASQPSGQGLHLCQAIHAEANALLQCRNINEISTVYCTASPCVQCMRLIRNTSARRVVFSELYPHPESEDLARRDGIEWVHLPHYDPDWQSRMMFIARMQQCGGQLTGSDVLAVLSDCDYLANR